MTSKYEIVNNESLTFPPPSTIILTNLVATLLLMAKGGGLSFPMPDEPDRLLEVVDLEGQSHLDPMFASVNMPALHQNQVADRLLDFVFQHVQP